MNSNKTAKMLDIIQAKRGITLGEVAEIIGRSRAYLSQAKARPDSLFLIRLLEEHFADELKGGDYEDAKSPAPDPVLILQDQVQDLRKHNEQLTKMNDSLLFQVQVNFENLNLTLKEQGNLIRQGQTLDIALAANFDSKKMLEIRGKMGKFSELPTVPKKGRRNSP